MTIAYRNVTKTFPDGTTALDRFELCFEPGEFVVLLGPSGCGKSTACRILAGLELPTSGRVEVGGVDITHVPPRARDMSMVFQSYALYPHKTVFENIAYPLRVRRTPKPEIDRAVNEMAAMLQIERLLARRPRQLSGGEAQRVAVARALVWRPQICLMDEPLSNLDALLRLKTRIELKRIHAELQKTFVFVTHDQEEALSLGTRIAVLNRGAIVQFATPSEIYHQPATRFVAEFIGKPAANTIEGRIDGNEFRAGELCVPLASRRPAALADGGPVVLGIRPEAIEVHAEPQPGSVAMTVQVVDVVPPDTILSLVCGTETLLARLPLLPAGVRAKSVVHVRFPDAALMWFAADGGKRLD
jgi:sn-glycerol 3-phosphate transport system ATP-binding protein